MQVDGAAIGQFVELRKRPDPSPSQTWTDMVLIGEFPLRGGGAPRRFTIGADFLPGMGSYMRIRRWTVIYESDLQSDRFGSCARIGSLATVTNTGDTGLGRIPCFARKRPTARRFESCLSEQLLTAHDFAAQSPLVRNRFRGLLCALGERCDPITRGRGTRRIPGRG